MTCENNISEEDIAIEKQEGTAQLPVSLDDILNTALKNGFTFTVETGENTDGSRSSTILLPSDVEVSFWSVSIPDGREVAVSLPYHAQLFAEAVNVELQD